MILFFKNKYLNDKEQNKQSKYNQSPKKNKVLKIVNALVVMIFVNNVQKQVKNAINFIISTRKKQNHFRTKLKFVKNIKLITNQKIKNQNLLTNQEELIVRLIKVVKIRVVSMIRA
jgi:hypothetical protein